MKKILKIIVLSLFFTSSAYAEFIELQKCFKSAVYGHGNQRVGLSKNWNDCEKKRERHELDGVKKLFKKGEWWYAWSIFFPKDQHFHSRYNRKKVSHIS